MTSLPTLSYGDYTVGWICALPTEMAAARAMLDEHHNPLQQNSRDHNTYTLGRIGRHNVVLACLPTGVNGTLSAARVANQMLQTFEGIRFGLMVGIGGGVPSEENDIRLGDIVVSMPIGRSGGVIQYDFGKTVQEGRFTRTGSLNRPPDVLLTALANLQSKHIIEGQELEKHLSKMLRRYPKAAVPFARPNVQHDLLFDAEYDHVMEHATCSQCDTGRLKHREPRPSEDPVIHYGLIASGDQVMRHGATRERLRKELNVLCFEMEAAGLVDEFPCLVVRGICDYADSHKNKKWQGYSAVTAAAYAKELLSVIPGNLAVNTRTAAENTKHSYQGLEFEEDSTTDFKNSESQIGDQTSDIAKLISNEDTNKSSTNDKVPLLRQDNRQRSSQTTWHLNIISKRKIQDANATLLLRENGFDIHEADFNTDEALLWAASKDRQGDMVQLLLREGGDVASKNRLKQTTLHLAAENGHEAVVRLLLEKKADISAKDEDERTALHLGAKAGHEAVVRLLLKKGAEIEAKNSDGKTALQYAAWKGHEAVVRLLLEKGTDAGTRTNDGRTALHRAASNGHETVVRLLLERGVDIKLTTTGGWKAIQCASSNGHEAVVRLLLENKDDINTRTNLGRTALHWATFNGHKAVVRLLLEKMADVEAVDSDGDTALHLAAKKGHKVVVRLLLEKGAEIEANDSGEMTALQHAAWKGHEMVVQLLLEKNADIEAKDHYRRTALHWAALNGNMAVVQLLLEKGAEIEANDSGGKTAVQHAAWKGHEVVVRLLLEKNADIEAKDHYGRTALHWAALNGYKAVVELLLEKDADVGAKDSDGETALRLAAKNGHQAVLQLLQRRN